MERRTLWSFLPMVADGVTRKPKRNHDITRYRLAHFLFELIRREPASLKHVR